jgi:hypothetical protein
MTVDIINPSRSTELDSIQWSEAEVLDTPFSDNLILRAFVCRSSPGKWQWTVSSYDGVRGELISAGTEKNAAIARQAAISEIAKCLEDPCG